MLQLKVTAGSTHCDAAMIRGMHGGKQPPRPISDGGSGAYKLRE